MKVFDYTKGRKGRLLGEVERPTWALGWISSKGFVIKLARLDPVGIVFRLAAGWTDSKTGQSIYLNPRDFGEGVEAVCFCLGEHHAGEDSHWEWIAVGTQSWVKNAIHSGLLTSNKV